MKILQTIMLLLQYVYYVMREKDKRWERSVRFTRIRTIGVLGIVETWMLFTVNLIIYRVIHGRTFHNLPLPPYSIIAAFGYGLVVYYINLRILGSDSRIQHYKAVFDVWDKGKRLRWKILLISISVVSLAAFFVIGEVTQNGLNTQNWK